MSKFSDYKLGDRVWIDGMVGTWVVTHVQDLADGTGQWLTASSEDSPDMSRMFHSNRAKAVVVLARDPLLPPEYTITMPMGYSVSTPKCKCDLHRLMRGDGHEPFCMDRT